MKFQCLIRNIIFIALSLILGICLGPSTSLGEPIEGQISDVLIAGNGKYVVASYTGPFVLIWDMDPLWDNLQPIQIHKFEGDSSFSTNAMPIAVSQDGKWLAYEDSGLKKIYVCEIEQGFPCRELIASDERFPTLDFSPDGSQLLIMTKTQLLVVDLANRDRVSNQKRHDWKNWECLKVGWNQGKIAIGTENGSLILLELNNLEEIGRFKVAPANSCEVIFTSDGHHVVAAWKTWNREASTWEQRLQVYDFDTQPSQPTIPMTIEEIEYIVPGDSADVSWYVGSRSSNEWKLMPSSPSGEKVTERSININIGRDSKVMAVSESRSYILWKAGIYGPLYLLDLKSQQPLFELNNSYQSPFTDWERIYQ